MILREIVLEIGAEGGSVTLLRERNGTEEWRFRMKTNEAALYDLLPEEYRDEIGSYQTQSGYVNSFPEAMLLLDKYPWCNLYPLRVHPGFLDAVLLEVRKRGGASEETRWREQLTFRELMQHPQSGNVPLGEDSCGGRSVREIHIDFLLEEEFRANPSFLEQFIRAGRKDRNGPFRVESVRRSVADALGEADLIIVYSRCDGDNERIAILIEDKVRAPFQPNQADRYRQRGECGKGHEWCDYWTCLVAPKSYVRGSAGDGFDSAITLEEIKQWIAASEPERHRFKAGVIEEAIQKAERTGAQQIDEAVTRFRELYYKYFKEFFADHRQHVDMRPPAPSWKGETWFRITSRVLQKGAYIHHKAPNACVDLTFPNTTAVFLKAAQPFLEEGMTIEQTGKSAAIRLAVRPIMQFRDFEQERSKVEEALASARRLLSFYEREHARLDPVLTNAASVPAK